jgi:hypothetical protein
MKTARTQALALVSCVSDDDKGNEEDPPIDGDSELKADSLRTPTEHGALVFGQAQTASLTGSNAFHAWTFSLQSNASVRIATSKSGSRNVDTVMYLYKKTGTSWGRYIARNDDATGTKFSAIEKSLAAGEYRVIVKGFASSSSGPFAINATCSGSGCAPANVCLFGSMFHELDTIAAVTVTGRSVAKTPAELSTLDQQRFIAAVQESAHTDVVTVEQAFAAVDQNEVNLVRIYEPAAARTYTAFEFGAGDDSYGAIFYWNTATKVAAIHDGDYQRCTVKAQTCILGSSYPTLRNDSNFRQSNARVVTAASQLTGVAAQQALLAIQVSAVDATTLAIGLTRIDGGELNVVTYTHRNGTVLTAYEFGAGDNSFGAVFVANTLTKAAEINDSDFYGCSLLQ